MIKRVLNSPKSLFVLYCLVFALTPLVWSSKNYELFEYNKMVLTYGLTVLIMTVWFFQMVSIKRFVVKRTFLDIPILLFLSSQVLSTIFSIDPHTSIWGYYSRSNGGLLSIITYILLYYGLISNLNREQVFKLLRVGLISGLIVSVWGIMEHFGASPSCLLLDRGFNDTCWIQDVKSRVFATLGQPNWMAAYLEMLIFPAFYFLLSAKSKWERIIYYVSLITLYTAFNFTFSQGATLGLIAGILVLVVAFLWKGRFGKKDKAVNLKLVSFLLITMLLVNGLFGSVFTKRSLGEYFSKKPPLSANPTVQVPGTTQLESGGTDSGKIRLIVWQGALDIFKHYPLFGSGVETFAYSYYNFRPAAHNMVSEWDFLYNKAHNEYLNYLATTGLFGFLSYLLMIVVFITWSVKYYLSNLNKSGILPVMVILAAYISYLVQNFFGFSVVIITLFFYLFPALAFIEAKATTEFRINLNFQRQFVQNFLEAATLVLGVLLLFSIFRIWYADTYFASGERAMDSGNAGRAYNYLSAASQINPGEPFYKSELGQSAASAAVALAETDATLSAHLKDEAIKETAAVLSSDPANVSFWRTAIRTYYELASLDKSFGQKTIDTLDRTIKLAPTDPKLYYNKAIILGQMDKNDEAIRSLQKAIGLKANYKEAYLALGLFYFDKNETDQAVAVTRQVFKYYPNDPDSLNQLNTWGKQGISTQTATPKP